MNGRIQQHAGADAIVAIIGNPLGHSLSPIMHNAAFQAAGLSWHYVPLEVESDQVLPLIGALKSSNVRGLNVTMPYKSTVLAAMDHVDEVAQACGAVNTIRFSGGKAYGYNTDCTGIVRSLTAEGHDSPAGADIVLLGAGGVAKAAAVGFAREKAASISVWGRDPARIDDFVSPLQDSFPDVKWSSIAGEQGKALENACKNADILINATPVGMFPHENDAPLPVEWISRGQLVMDLIYRPAKTKLLVKAEEQGAQILSGAGTFLQQAVEAFTIWTDQPAPVDVMQDILRGSLGYAPPAE